MSGSLTKYLEKSAARLSPGDQGRALAATADDGSAGGGDYDFLYFNGKQGTYSLGQKKAEPEGMYMIHPDDWIAGWICWKGAEAVGRIELPATTSPMDLERVHREDFGPYKDATEGWFKLRGFGCFDLNGRHPSDGGRPAKFTNNSKSGRNAIGDFMREAGQRMADGEDALCVPVFTFYAEEFTAQGNTNFKPMFDVETWVTERAFVAWLEGKLEAKSLISGKLPRKKQTRKKAA